MKMRVAMSTVVLMAVFAAAAPAVDFGNINLGDVQKVLGATQKVATAMRDISPQEETEIGRGMAAGLLGAAPLLNDPEAQRYVNRVGRWCASQAGRPELQWRFGVLDDNDINAFAAPGGYIFVTKGLLAIAGSEAELAGVLSHEIGHVIAKHHLNAIKNQAMQGLLGDLAGEALSGGQFNAAPFIAGGMNLFAKGLDRNDEYEADRMGVVVATRAGYEPYGLPRILVKLGHMNPQSGGLQLMTSTHPPAADRLSRLQQIMTGGFERYGDQPLLEQRYAQNLQHLFPH